MLNNKKALSPVVASIILITVTVAVSIAVAAWMGAPTFIFTATEQLQITKIDFAHGGFNVTILNTGITPVTIMDARVNNQATSITGVNGNGVDYDDTAGTVTIQANTRGWILVSGSWENGKNYEIKLISSKGNVFMRTETAPTD
ncbi:MAG: archaellin/type IV pilin N-terminal domain-containing protein [Nitrososphaerota archaeon]|nr:hypothetical protein [Candidatus Bathyarchaeota archaeon]MDW8194338.1 archaellin/type IV pilin N-terminal domain-containing protein [Nitrososphaerota archaeon]